MTDTTNAACAKCAREKLLTELKRCAACRKVNYCDQVCQKAHWGQHKLDCTGHKGKQDNGSLPSESSSTSGAQASSIKDILAQLKPVPMDASRLDPKAMLHGIPEAKAFAYLIDSYRLRIEDTYVFTGDAIGLYGGNDPVPSFREYLTQAEQRSGILPVGWNKAAKQRCVKLAADKKGGHCIHYAVEKSDIQDLYKDQPLISLQLRGLAEVIEGCSVQSMMW